ncbi:MAG TPA: hypothetical protein VL860_00670 [Planctomycetota bacterium]|nr:hypothetical protein [Planctomycetota bacterium]
MTESQSPAPAATPGPLAPAAGASPAAAPAAVAVSASITIDDFKKVRLITAKVLSAVEHPSADKLVILKLDIGAPAPGPGASAAAAPAPRQICAGIRQFYPVADLVGRTIILVENLAPRKLRGEMSEGMLLAVHDGGVLSLLTTDKPVAPGLVVG